MSEPDERTPEEKRRLLSKPHILPLTELVAEWRSRLDVDSATGLPCIPDFDPCDGGIHASMLFLMEKPGRRAAPVGGSGFISQDNNDPTARAIKTFLRQAGIPRNQVVLWNAIAMWDGQRHITPEQRNQAPNHLRQLLARLVNVRVIVLVGGKAAEAFERILASGENRRSYPEQVRSLHPSPVNKAARPSEWKKIPETWRAAANQAGVFDSSPRILR